MEGKRKNGLPENEDWKPKQQNSIETPATNGSGQPVGTEQGDVVVKPLLPGIVPTIKQK